MGFVRLGAVACLNARIVDDTLVVHVFVRMGALLLEAVYFIHENGNASTVLDAFDTEREGHT